MNTMKWLLKREFWEHKGGFFWAPVVVSVLLALLTIGSMLFISVADSKWRLPSGRQQFRSQPAAGPERDHRPAEDRVRPRAWRSVTLPSPCR